MAQAFGWDIIQAFALLPASGETVNSEHFSCPKRAFSMALHIPMLSGASPTVKIQSLDPVDKTTWRDVATYNLTNGLTRKIDLIPQNQVTTIPVANTGSGILRLVADQDQSGAPVNITVAFMLAP